MPALVGCSEARHPDVVVILIDALRADHLGAYGYERPTSPQLDALAEESLLFRSAHAQSPWTKPSVPTLFTSLYPIQHGVYEGEAHAASGGLESDVLADGYTTLAERFSDAGYATFGAVNNAHLEARHGFSQGFEVYLHGNADAEEISRSFFEFLDAEEGERPLFAYLHYLDVHWPFQAELRHRERFGAGEPSTLFDRASWRGLRDGINEGSIELGDEGAAQLVGRHDAAIAAFDERLGELISGLRERGLLDDAVVLITSDHGEELLDHGRVGHGGTLYREVIEVPMLLRLPGAVPRGPRREAARLIDVVPTLLAAAGLPAAGKVEGRNLLEAPASPVELVAETRHKRSYRVSLRDGDWKYIRSYNAPRHAPGGGHGDETDLALQPGLRVKATGILRADGVLQARKLRLRDAGDDDLELSGTVARHPGAAGSFQVLGIGVDGRALEDAARGPAARPLLADEWVKVEGDANADGVLVADKVEWLAEDDRDEEIEGIVSAVTNSSADEWTLHVGPARVVVDENTRLRGIDVTRAPPDPSRSAPAADPFSPEALLSPEAPPFVEQLFDLASDPHERADLAAAPAQRARIEEMRRGLDAWLERMSRHQRLRADRSAIDENTIEELKRLGYLE